MVVVFIGNDLNPSTYYLSKLIVTVEPVIVMAGAVTSLVGGVSFVVSVIIGGTGRTSCWSIFLCANK